MKIIFTVLMLITLLSCSQNGTNNSTDTGVSLGHTSALQIIDIDGCQYLYGDWYNSTVLTHKGNCNNPIHKMIIK